MRKGLILLGENSLAHDKTASFRNENWRFWSGLRDSNPRSLGPKPSAIPNFAKPGYEIRMMCRCGQICGQGNSTTVLPNFQRKESGVIAKIKGSMQHFGKSNRFGVPAPKASALPS